MITKIEKQEIMTVRDMRTRYSDKWFMYTITGELNLLQPLDNMGFVIYTADTEDELLNMEGHNSSPIHLGVRAYMPTNCGCMSLDA